MKVSDCCRKPVRDEDMYDEPICSRCLAFCEEIEVCDDCMEEQKYCDCEPKLFSWVDGVYKPENK